MNKKLGVYGDQGCIVNWAGLTDYPAEGTSNMKFFPAQWQSPLLSWVNYYIPWDRATLFQWIRFYDTFHPYLGSCIDLHTQLPLSRFGLKSVTDETVLRFYEETLDHMDAYNLMYDQLREWWLIGESYTYLVWSDKLNTFVDAEILPPEYIEVRGHPLVLGEGLESSFEFFLIPDESLVRFVKSDDETSERLRNNLPTEVIEAIEQNKLIRINPFNLMVMMRKQSRYNPRGTSIVLRCLKDLLYEDKIREASYAIADRNILPLEIWRVGNEKYPPSSKRINKIAAMVRDLQDQPKKNIVTHWAVSYEVVGAVGKFPNLSSEFDWVERRILTSLFTNKAMTTGEGPCYDKDTEVLTNNGFKFYDQVLDTDLIATFNKKTGRLEYQKPIRSHKWHYCGLMYKFNTDFVDVAVTPDHRMLVGYKNNTSMKRKEVKDKDVVWGVYKAEEIGGKCVFRQCVEWKGVVPKKFMVIGDKKILINDYLEFLGYLISNGCVDVPGGRVSIVCRKESVAKKVRKCLKKLPYEVREELGNDKSYNFDIYDDGLVLYLYSVVGGFCKRIPVDVKSYDKKYLKILFDALLFGHKVAKSGGFVYVTNSKMIADDVSEIILKLGMVPYVSDGYKCYNVYFTNNIRNKFPVVRSNTIKRVSYNDYVWCFEVPNGFFITRRNGKIGIHGNTYSNASVAMRALLSRYIQVRSYLEQSWILNVFYPIAVANGFYKTTQAELDHKVRKPYKDREPIIPQFDWRYKSNLLDDTSHRELIVRMYDKRQIPFRIVAEVLGLEYDYVKEWLKKEEGTVFDTLYSQYREGLMKKGIPFEEVPKFPGPEEFGTAFESKQTDQHSLRRIFDKEERKEKLHAEEKGKPKEPKLKDDVMEIKDNLGSMSYVSSGGIKRKLRISEMLYEQRKDKGAIGGKVNIGGLTKDNISFGDNFPKELSKMQKPKNSVVIVRERDA